MDLNSIEQYVDLLIFIHSNPNVVASSILSSIKITTTRLYVLLNDWAKDGILIKKKKDQISPGGDQFEFKIAKKGERFLNNIARKLEESNIKSSIKE